VEAPELDRFYRDNKERANLLVIGVGDSEDALRQMVASGGYKFPLIVDTANVAAMYGISVIPTVVLIDPSGKVAKSLSEVLTADSLANLVQGLVSP
jgi:peroxiredoxin